MAHRGRYRGGAGIALFRQIAAMQPGAVGAQGLEVETPCLPRAHRAETDRQCRSFALPFSASVMNASARSLAGAGTLSSFLCPIASVMLAFNSFGHILRNSAFEG